MGYFGILRSSIIHLKLVRRWPCLTWRLSDWVLTSDSDLPDDTGGGVSRHSGLATAFSCIHSCALPHRRLLWVPPTGSGQYKSSPDLTSSITILNKSSTLNPQPSTHNPQPTTLRRKQSSIHPSIHHVHHLDSHDGSDSLRHWCPGSGKPHMPPLRASFPTLGSNL